MKNDQKKEKKNYGEMNLLLIGNQKIWDFSKNKNGRYVEYQGKDNGRKIRQKIEIKEMKRKS